MRRDKVEILLNEQPEDVRLRRLAFDEAYRKFREFEFETRAIKRDCNHVTVRHVDSWYCIACDTYGGWYCDESPTKYCEYSEDDWNRDFCIHCDNPEERK